MQASLFAGSAAERHAGPPPARIVSWSL